MQDLLTDINWLSFLFGAIAVFVGAVIQGAAGIGLGLVAAPILMFIDPSLVPGPLLALGWFISWLILLRERRAVDVRGLAYALIGRLPGIALAGLTFAFLPEVAFGLLFGGLLLAAVLTSVMYVRLQPTPRNLLLAGFGSGFMGTLTSVGGPPLALVYQNQTAPVVRSTLAVYFLIGSAMSIAALYTVGRFGLPQVIASAMFLPPLFIGFYTSNSLVRRASNRAVRASVLWISGLSALILLMRSLFNMIVATA